MARWLMLWLARRVFRSRIDRRIGESAPVFFGHLRREGYPRAGGLIVIPEDDVSRAKFMGALLWALDKTLETEEIQDA